MDSGKKNGTFHFQFSPCNILMLSLYEVGGYGRRMVASRTQWHLFLGFVSPAPVFLGSRWERSDNSGMDEKGPILKGLKDRWCQEVLFSNKPGIALTVFSSQSSSFPISSSSQHLGHLYHFPMLVTSFHGPLFIRWVTPQSYCSWHIFSKVSGTLLHPSACPIALRHGVDDAQHALSFLPMCPLPHGSSLATTD